MATKHQTAAYAPDYNIRWLEESDGSIVMGLSVGPHEVVVYSPLAAVSRSLFERFLRPEVAFELEHETYAQSRNLIRTGSVRPGWADRPSPYDEPARDDRTFTKYDSPGLADGPGARVPYEGGGRHE